MKIEFQNSSNPPVQGRWLRLALANVVVMIALVLAVLLSAAPAQAKNKYAAFIFDAESGKVLLSSHADSRRYPASLTKMMTLYMAFDALQSGRFNKDTRLKVSRHAANRPPSKLGLKPGSRIRVEDVIYALVTKSANDAAVVLAESIGGTESNFGRLMTKKARALGMKSTVFRNASGLPNRKQVTTARDMATLGRRLFRDFPQYYHYFSTEKYTYKGRALGNHNNLLGVYEGTDGIKTGYINASGFNLVSSVRRDGYHLIGVVFGGKTARRRDKHMISILDKAFKRLPARSTPQRLALNEAPVPSTKPAVPIAVPRVIALVPRTKPGTVQIAAAQTPAQPPSQAKDDRIAALISTQSKAPAAYEMAPISSSGPIPHAKPTRSTASSAASTAGIVSAMGSRRGEDWGIQVGAFSEVVTAQTHMSDLMTSYPDILSRAATAVQPYQADGQTLFRARLEGFAEAQARGVCKTLVAGGKTCVPVPPGSLFGQGNG